MGLELIAAMIAAVACAGVAMALRKLSRNRTPKWLTPAAAALGLIGFTVWNEYDWYGRLAGNLPEGVQVVWADTNPQPLRPWTMLAPLTTRFTAMDTRKLAPHPDNAALVLAPVYNFARWQGVEEGFLVIDCVAGRSVLLTQTVRIDAGGTLTGGEWQPLAADDAIRRTGCREG